MFTEIHLKNFKGLAEADISLSYVNVFVGENGTGKSTIGQALEILKMSRASFGINTNLPDMNLGPIDKLVRAGEMCNITLKGHTDLHLGEPFDYELNYECSITIDSVGLNSYISSVAVGEFEFSNSYSRNGPVVINPPNFLIKGINFIFQPIRSIGQLFQTIGYNSPARDQKMANEIYESLMKISSVIVDELQKITIIPVFRGFLEPTYPIQPGFTQEMNIRGSMVQVAAAEASNLMYLDEPSKQKIRELLKYIVDVDLEVKVIPGAQVAIINPEKDVFITSEGFGSNQLIPILSAIVRAQKGSLILIEEPEIHLHPRAQFRLGYTIPKIAREKEIQVILVTHSEHVVSGILSAIRKKETTSDFATIWLFEREKSRNVVSKCKINEDGSTEGGLKTFIQAAIEEIQEIAKNTQKE